MTPEQEARVVKVLHEVFDYTWICLGRDNTDAEAAYLRQEIDEIMTEIEPSDYHKNDEIKTAVEP